MLLASTMAVEGRPVMHEHPSGVPRNARCGTRRAGYVHSARPWPGAACDMSGIVPGR
jgi:hypothetical protein